MTSRRSSGSRRAERAVEPTRSQNITVSCRAVVGGEPMSARAQQAGKVFRIGVLSLAGQTSTNALDAFREGLAQDVDTELQSSLVSRRSRSPQRRPCSARFVADSPLEGAVSSEPVSGRPKFPVSREFTGNC